MNINLNKLNQREKVFILTKDIEESTEVFRLLRDNYKFNIAYSRFLENDFIGIEIITFDSIYTARAIRCHKVVFTDKVIKELLYNADKSVSYRTMSSIACMSIWSKCESLSECTFFFEDIDWIYKTLEENYKSEGV